MKCPQLYQALPLCVHVSACFSSLSLFLQFFVYDLRVMETFMGYIMVPKFLLEEISCSEGNKILFTKKKKKNGLSGVINTTLPGAFSPWMPN